MHRLAHVEALQGHRQLARDFRRVDDQFHLVADDVEHAALGEARAIVLVGEHDGHVHVHGGVLAHAQEIDMHRPIADDVERDILGERALRLARALDQDHRIHEMPGAQRPDERLLLQVDSGGGLVLAVDHGGDAALAAQRTGGSLAHPVTRLGRERQLVAHAGSPKRCSVSAAPPGMTAGGSGRA